MLTTDGSKLVLFATDGLHLSYEETKDFQLLRPFKAILKASTLETISRILGDDILGDDAEVEIQAEENKILFHCGNVDVVCQIMSGNFPDYKLLESSFPKPTTKTVISTLELLKASRHIKVFASEIGTSKVDISGMLMKFSALTLDKGEGEILLPIAKEGEDILIGINVHFLEEFLEICKTEKLTIEFAGNNGPILLKMQNFDSYYHVIMPVLFYF